MHYRKNGIPLTNTCLVTSASLVGIYFISCLPDCALCNMSITRLYLHRGPRDIYISYECIENGDPMTKRNFHVSTRMLYNSRTLYNKDHPQCSFSLVVNSGTTDWSSSLGTSGLVKQLNLTKITTRKQVTCMKNSNMICFGVFTPPCVFWC